MNFRKILPLLLVSLALGAIIFYLSERKNQEAGSENPELSIELQKVTAADLLALIQTNEARLTVVNFWATFCGPCREEFPYFLSAYREYKDEGLELYFVSMDFDSDIPQIEEFLNEQGVDFRTYLRTGKDDDFIRAMHPDWSGVLPMTLIYDSKKQLVHYLPKTLNFEELEDLIVKVLKGENGK